MKQVRLYGQQDLRMDEVPAPSPGPADAVVKVAMSGICGTDLGFLRQGYIGLRPHPGCSMPLGHEVVGTIHAVGEAVQGLALGQRVVVHPMRAPNRIGTGDPAHGAFAEYLLVRDAAAGKTVFPVSERLSDERIALAEPLAVAMHGLNIARAAPGESAIIYGAGPIGLSALVCLKHRGAGKVAVVDVVPHRLERARQLGADIVVNPQEGELRAALLEQMGTVRSPFTGQRKVDCALHFDCAGHGPLLEQAINLACTHARIVMLATHKQPVPLNMTELMMQEVALLGSISYPDEFPEVLAMLEDERIDLRPMVSHVYAFAEFQDAFATAQQAGESAKVLLRMA